MAKVAGGKIGVGGFFALTGSMVMTIYSYPAFASSGFALVFFLLLAGLLYFLPTALISAEMATGDGWQDGGVYRWCSVAFGKRWGFFAIFMQWLQITIGFVTMLYFIVGALAYLTGFHIINENPLYKFIVLIVAFWCITFMNLRGTKFTAKFATIGFTAGIIVPAVVIIVIAVVYVIGGHPVGIKMDEATFFPDFTQINTLVILVAFMLSYLGIEASAVHANSLRKPQRDYPIAILLLTATAIVLNVFGALSIAIVVPADKISMNAGILQAVAILFGTYGIGWVVHIMAGLIALGAVAEIGSWVVGPVHGLYVAAKDGLLPKSLNQVNKHKVPQRLVLVQGVVVTIWAAVLTFGGGGANLSYLLAMALTVVTYLFMYVLLYFRLLQTPHLARRCEARLQRPRRQSRPRRHPRNRPTDVPLRVGDLLLSPLADRAEWSRTVRDHSLHLGGGRSGPPPHHLRVPRRVACREVHHARSHKIHATPALGPP